MRSPAENARFPFALFLMTMGWIVGRKRKAPAPLQNNNRATTNLEYMFHVPTKTTLKKGPGFISEFFVSLRNVESVGQWKSKYFVGKA